MLVDCQLLSEMKILNVEDEPQLSTQIARALRRANHEVDTASDGPSGLKLAMEDRYDIIVLDVNLPGFDGFEHTVNSHINRLRSKIEADAREPRCIVTVWGVGYRFDPPPA